MSAEDPQALAAFYEQAYSSSPERSELYARWRALGAVGKADHVVALCERAGLAPRSVLDVGCGDGALLSELARRGFAARREGLEISAAAVAIARARPEIDRVEEFDGAHLPGDAGAYELGVLSHVLEHVLDPPALLAEVARACRAVVIEVPLEHNLSAARAAKRRHSEEVGHLRRLDRPHARRIVTDAGLLLRAEIEDPLPLAVQRFFAGGPLQTSAAYLKWALRAGLHGAAPVLARRLFTVHYAALCLPPGA